MAIRKYTTSESLEVVRGKKAVELNRFMRRTGKYDLTELTTEEETELKGLLDEVKEDE